ncbi:MAG: class I SAM-dependent methyltransferase [Candidatus Omnitrophota bacterium]
MKNKIDSKLIERGIEIGESKIFHEDKVWSRYSNDKVDIGEGLAKVIRTLMKALPIDKEMKALSIGSSDEPQFRILETAFRGGLYLIDLEQEALAVVKERIRRQYTDHVTTIRSDYTKIFLNPKKTRMFLKMKMGGVRANLVTLHHSLYYCEAVIWKLILDSIYKEALAKQGAIHAVLMASESGDTGSTTWLYNHFVGKFFGCINDQNLLTFKKELKKDPLYRGAQILSRTNKVSFFVDDFEKFMAVIWMILLYPDVHQYILKQREQITEFIYKKFWIKKRPLVQDQDHLVIYRGIPFRGLI